MELHSQATTLVAIIVRRGLSADLDLELRDQFGSVIGSSASNSTSSERISARVSAGDTVYVGVKPYGPTQSTYSVTAEFQADEVNPLDPAETLFDGKKLLTLADFALAAYDNPEGQAARARLENDGNGWAFLDHEKVDEFAWSDTFFSNENAAAVVARSDDALVISFRGTEMDGFSVLNALLATVPAELARTIVAVLTGRLLVIPLLLKGAFDSFVAKLPPDTRDWLNMDEHFGLFKPFISAIDKYLNSVNQEEEVIKEIYVVGHSLGAAMVNAFLDQGNHRGDNYFGAAFANPGYEYIGLGNDPRIDNFWTQDDVITWAAGIKLNPGDKTKFFFNDAVDTIFDDPGFVPFSITQHSMGAYREMVRYLYENGVSNKTLEGETAGVDHNNFVVPFDMNAQGSLAFANGNNKLTSYGGGHILVGGLGNDTYVVRTGVGTAGDTIIEWTNQSSIIGDTLELVGRISGVRLEIGPTEADLRVVPLFAAQTLAPITIKNHFTVTGRVEHITFGGRSIDLPATQGELGNWDGKVFRAPSLPDVVFEEQPDGSLIGTIDAPGGASLFDTISFDGLKSPVTMNLETGIGSILGALTNLFDGGSNQQSMTAAAAAGGSRNDVIVNIAGMENITGTGLRDTLIGSKAANVLDGGAGSDTMRGGRGNDT